MKKTDILFLTFDFPPQDGGISVIMSRIFRCLGERALVLTTNVFGDNESKGCETKAKIVRENFNINVNNFKLLFVIFKVLFKSLRLHGKFKFRTILVGEVFPLGLVGLFFKYFLRTNLVTFSHGSDSLFSKNKIRNYLVGIAYRSAEYVLCFSDYTKNNLLKWKVKEGRIKKISAGVDTDLFNPEVDTAPIEKRFNLKDKRVILSVNRLIIRKGIDTAIKCMPRLIKEVPSVFYLIVGDGSDKKRLEDLAKDLHVENHCLFAGSVKQEDLAVYYCLSELFLNLVREIKNPLDPQTEGFGLINIEAGACSKAVIAGKTGGVVDAIEDKRTGLLIDPLDLEQITNAILRLLRDRHFAKELGKNAREKVLNEFRLENLNQDLDKILQNLK
ncbi:MAG: glycosyltransferase family 4 protein [Candidatus Omnitrophica bacterium]|nr:glycosyltransferase family 4 protein [Candidatus Omnitrophota bacterium]